MKRIILLSIVLCLLIVECAFASVHRVPEEHPTIQAAIDASTDGDVVLVAPGTYTGDGNRDIGFLGKAITVESETGPRTCIIDCEATWHDRHRGFCFHSKEGRDSILDGFTITGGNQQGGAGIMCMDASPTVQNCIIVGNIGSMGAGIYLMESDALLFNCIIGGNLGRLGPLDWPDICSGGGLYCSIGHPVVRNCTIHANVAHIGGGVNCLHGRTTAVFINSIVAGNRTCSDVWKSAYAERGKQLLAGGCIRAEGCANVELINCCVGNEPNAIFVENWSDASSVPDGSIQADPLCAQEGHWDPNGTATDSSDDIWINGDYHLKSQAGRWDPNSGSWVQDDATSPCIDAGDPNSPIGYEPFPNGGVINIGAYGGTSEASKSYFGEPISDTIVAGDINGDRKVDFLDFMIMASHWLQDGSAK